VTNPFQPEISVVMPAYDEESNVGACIDELAEFLIDTHGIRTEIIVVNDNSRDGTEAEVLKRMERWPTVRLIRRKPPGGFGRALRTGLDFARGEVVIVYMTDRSDHPEDALLYYQKIREGYDCVFGSRFIPGEQVQRYPRGKLLVNRIVNKAIQWMFWTPFNDTTNAFKAY